MFRLSDGAPTSLPATQPGRPLRRRRAVTGASRWCCRDARHSRLRDCASRSADREVVKGFDLTMQSGEVHAIMGPNGSGKSTLAHALTGHPGYRVLDGSVRLDGVELLTLSPTERARAGLLLALQQPFEIPGRATVRLARSGRRRSCDVAGSHARRGAPRRTTPRTARSLRERRSFGRRAQARRDGPARRAAPEVRRCSTRSTPGSTSTPSTPSPDVWSQRPPSGTAACSRSPTSVDCSSNCRRP